MTADIARIKEMESILDECSETIASLRDEVDKMRSFRDSMTKLFDMIELGTDILKSI